MDNKWTKSGQKKENGKGKNEKEIDKMDKNRQKRTKDGHWTKSGKKFNRKGQKVDRKSTKSGQKIDKRTKSGQEGAETTKVDKM